MIYVCALECLLRHISTTPLRAVRHCDLSVNIIRMLYGEETISLVLLRTEEHCQSAGTASVIQLKPIIDWTDKDVWDYIHKYNLPINPEYKTKGRVGCIVCPKANLTHNADALIRYPKLIDAFIRAREKRRGHLD